MLAIVACSVALDGFTSGAEPTDGGPESSVAESGPGDSAPPMDAANDVVTDDAALPDGCQGAVACERVVFVTHDTFAVSDFGGLVGADAICERVANAAGAVARVRNRPFRAWLGTTATNASSRNVHGSMHYIRTDNAVIASSWNQIVGGSLALNLDVDETGHDLAAPDIAWTGTITDGTHDDMLCDDWTSSSASVTGKTGFTSPYDVDASPASWTFGDDTPCDQRAHLYCFEY
jgi:hypothetical protein